jgi:hypothetical protein
MSGKIYGNSAIVQTMLINNRSDRRIADKEFQRIFETVNTIESNFYDGLFNSEYDYLYCFDFYKNLYEDFTNDFNKKSIYYKVHPNYFINNYKPLERCH